jgi:DNA polymerase-1
MGKANGPIVHLMFVSDAPGDAEVRIKQPFAGTDGKIIREQLADLGISLEYCYFTYLVKCKFIQGKLPAVSIKECEGYLREEILEHKPTVIIPLGKSVCNYFGFTGAMEEMRGIPQYNKEFQCYIVPTYSPRYLNNFSSFAPQYKKFKTDLVKAWEIAQGEVGSAVARPVSYIHATSIAEVQKVKKILLGSELFTSDTETTSLSAQGGEILMTSFSIQPYEGYSIPYKHPKVFETPSGRREVLKELQEIYNNPIRKVFHNAKYDIQMLWAEKIQVQGLYFDTMLAHYLLDENSPHGLGILAPIFTDMGDYKDEVGEYIKGHIILPREELFHKYATTPIAPMVGDPMVEFAAWLKKNKIKKADAYRKSTIFDCPLDKLQHYATQDTDATFRLYKVFDQRLKEEGCDKVFYHIVMPLCQVLAKMEFRGILTNKEYIAQLVKKYSQEQQEATLNVLSSKWVMKYLQKYPKAEYGEFNLNSPDQKVKLLYEIMNLRPPRMNRLTETQKAKGKTSGNPSTDADALEDLCKTSKEKILRDILAYQKIKKFKEYVDGYEELTEKRDVIHTDYKQTGTVTGRLSSSSPNLQNIPKNSDPEKAKLLRTVFIARPGYTLVEADFSSAEFFVWGVCSQDKKLIEFLTAKDENGEYLDIHRQVAATVFRMPAEKVTKEQRNMAKAIVYGLMYGRSSYSIAAEYNMSEEEVNQFISGLFAGFPKAMNWIEDQPKQLEKNGFIRTVFGRRRRIDEIYSKKFEEKEAAQRQARNFPIQSAAGDMCFAAIIKLDRLFKDYDAHLILQIHDSVVMEVKDELLIELLPKIEETMSNAVPKMIQMRAGVDIGKSLGTMLPYKKVSKI